MDPHTPDGKAEWVVHEQHRSTAHDATGLCLFVGAGGGPLETFVPITAAATGVPYTLDDFVKIGERTWNLERLWNLKAGLTKADDALPERLMKVPAPSGTAKGMVSELDIMLPEYYEYRGWTPDGEPTSQTLTRLGLGDLAGS